MTHFGTPSSSGSGSSSSASSPEPEAQFNDTELSVVAPPTVNTTDMQMSRHQGHQEAPNTTTPVTATRIKDSKAIHFLAGGVAGSLAATFTMPLDVVKTRKQASQDAQLRSIVQAKERRLFTQTYYSIVNIFKREGFRGLFRGLGPNLVGIAPSRAIYFFTYNLSKENVSRLSGGTLTRDSPIVHMTSAAIGGICVASVMNPIWLVKTRIQLQEYSSPSAQLKSSSVHYTGYLDCVRKIYHSEGIKGFYKGLFASYMGVSETVIYFVIYEKLKKQVMKHSHAQFDAVSLFTLAGFTKLLASISTYPHEVVRTRMRQVGQVNPVIASSVLAPTTNGLKYKYNGVISTFRLIAREEGIRGLYSGMGAHLMRTVPNSAIMMLTYEFIISLFSKHNR